MMRMNTFEGTCEIVYFRTISGIKRPRLIDQFFHVGMRFWHNVTGRLHPSLMNFQKFFCNAQYCHYSASSKYSQNLFTWPVQFWIVAPQLLKNTEKCGNIVPDALSLPPNEQSCQQPWILWNGQNSVEIIFEKWWFIDASSSTKKPEIRSVCSVFWKQNTSPLYRIGTEPKVRSWLLLDAAKVFLIFSAALPGQIWASKGNKRTSWSIDSSVDKKFRLNWGNSPTTFFCCYKISAQLNKDKYSKENWSKNFQKRAAGLVVFPW